MKTKYLLGLLLSGIAVQSAIATSFTIASRIVPSARQRLYIDSIAPLYKGISPVYQKVPQQTLSYKLMTNKGLASVSSPGIYGTTPGGLTHLAGVAFKLTNGKVYVTTFTEAQKPSRIAVNVLLEIYENPQAKGTYFGKLYQDSRESSAPDIVMFKELTAQ